MSQLPEVEVARKDLEKVVGAHVTEVVVRSPALVARHRSRPEFVRALMGASVTSVTRRGIHLVLGLSEERALVMRLGQDGMLTRESVAVEPDKAAQLVITFDSGLAVHYVDPGKDAEVAVVPAAELASMPELSKSGIDLLADTFTWHAFGEELARREVPLGTLLLDPTFVVGLGGRYRDEVLWTAGLSAGRPCSGLVTQEVRRLHRSMLEVVHDAVKQRTGEGVVHAAHAEDDDEPERGGWLRVWGRDGEPCGRCRQALVLAEVADGDASYHCANCQT